VGGRPRRWRRRGLGALADLGFVGLDQGRDDPVAITGAKRTRTKKLTTGQKTANQIIAAARAPVEHSFAALKNWRISPTAAEPGTGNGAATRPARTHQPRDHPLTDDQEHRHPPTNSTSTRESRHTRALTGSVMVARSQ
jgi:hypothetical protein